MTVVHMRHVRAAGMCSRGARAFCLSHNLDWQEFLKSGLPVSSLDGIDDEMLRSVIARAKDEELVDGQGV